MKSIITNNSTVLFLGDSITDAGRSRDTDDNLGQGYVMMISSWFSAMYPEKNVKFINRGISGNRVKDLKSRLQEDCLGIKPDIISILIGINDTWRKYDSNDPTSVEQFELDYREILQKIVSNLNAKIILCEPFLLHISKDIVRFREDLNPKIEVVRKLAKEFKTILVPLDKIFNKYSKKRNPFFWASDGIHPTLPGHALIAQIWLKIVGKKNI